MPRSPLFTARFRGRAALDIESVVARSLGDVALQEAVALLLQDHERIDAAVSDPVSAHDVVCAGDERVLDPEADAGPASMGDEVVGDEVAVTLRD
jgi:hypothetical protein